MHERDAAEESAARKIRDLAGVTDRYCCDLIFVRKELQRKGELRWRVSSDASMPDDEASYDADAKTLTLAARTFHVLDHPFRAEKMLRRRARFSVAHELSHWIEGHPGTHFRGSISERARATRSKVGFNEFQANRIAAAVLVPYELANDERDELTLSEMFDVNAPVARHRIPVLDRMARRASGQKRPLPDTVVRLLLDAVSRGHKVTSLTDRDRTMGHAGVCEACGQMKRPKPSAGFICGCISTP